MAVPEIVQHRGVNVLNPPPGGQGGLLIQNNFKTLAERAPKFRDSAVVPPTATDDISQGWYPRSLWIMPTEKRVFVCVRNDPNAADWLELTAIAGGLKRLEDDEEPTLSANLDASTWRIVNLGTPINEGDASNKAYVDSRFTSVQGDLAAHAGRTDNPHSVTAAQVGAIPTSHRGIAGGVAPLDEDGKVPLGFLPSWQTVSVYVANSQAEMLALPATTASICVRPDVSKTFILQGTDPTQLSDWVEMPSPTGAVTSFNGRIGAILPAFGDYTAAQIAWSSPPGMLATSVEEGLNELAYGKANADHLHGINDITGLADAIASMMDGYAPASHTHTIAQISGLSAALEAKAPYNHTHQIGDVDGLQAALDGKANGSHTHTIAQITSLQSTLDGKSNVGHSHTISDTTGLQNALDNRAQLVHTHQMSDIVGLATAITNKSEVGHTHAISDTIGLQNALNEKANSNHTHTITNISGLQSVLDNKAGVAELNAHISDTDNPHGVTAEQVGAVPTEALGVTVCTLVGGKIPDSFMPALAISDTFVVASEAEMLSLVSAQRGDIAVRTDINATFILRSEGPTVLGNWQELRVPTGIGGVSSFNGRTGSVSPMAGDYTSAMIQFTSATTHGTRSVRQAIDELYDAIENVAGDDHTHEIEDITGLTVALAAKANVSHEHSLEQITGLSSALAGKANTAHTHSISQIANLEEVLDAKADSTHTHQTTDIDGLDAVVETVENLDEAFTAHVGASNPHGVTWYQVGAQQSTIAADRDPGADDDEEDGHAVKRLWLNTETHDVFMCVDATAGSAVWRKITLNTQPDSYVVPVRVSHYEGIGQVRWHMQAQITALSDTNFLTPLISKDSSANQINWTFRRDGYSSDGALQSFPADGILTDAEDAYGEFARVATAFYALTTGELSLLARGTTYWLRVRQSSDGGETWGNWTVEPITIP